MGWCQHGPEQVSFLSASLHGPEHWLASHLSRGAERSGSWLQVNSPPKTSASSCEPGGDGGQTWAVLAAAPRPRRVSPGPPKWRPGSPATASRKTNFIIFTLINTQPTRTEKQTSPSESLGTAANNDRQQELSVEEKWNEKKKATQISPCKSSKRNNKAGVGLSESPKSGKSTQY